MELRQLRYFTGVARELNFTRAAAKLRVAQPALSRQIRQLEAEMGVALLVRDSQGTRLTDAGKAFFLEAEALLRQSEQAVRTAQSNGRSRPVLNVGYVWGLFHTVVPAWVAAYRQAQPDVAVNLFDQSATQQAQALAQGKLDVGFIGFAYEADAARLSKKKVGACAFLAALPARHPAARQRTVALGTLAQDSFVVISEEAYPGAANLVAGACARAKFRPRILQSVERGHTILGLVASGCGVALLPEPLKELPHEGVVFRPLADAPKSDLYVAWDEERISALGKAMIAGLQKLSTAPRSSRR